MASTTTELICNNFGGIRKKNSSFSSELITCSDCQNVELFDTNQNSGIGIRTSKSNIKVLDIKDTEKIYNMYSCNLGGVQYLFLYTVEGSKGALKYYDSGKLYQIGETFEIGDLYLSSFSLFNDSWLDILVFSNGETIKYFYVDNSSEETRAEGIQEFDTTDETNVILKDTEGRKVSGLGLVNFDSRLWLFKNNILWYSKQGDCKKFNFQDPDYIASSGYIEMGKKITAIHIYNGQLAVFFKDGYRLVTTDTTTGFGVGSECSLGCSEQGSLLYHGSDLYVFDNEKKMVYSLSQTSTGDTATTDNLADDIVDILSEINYFRVGVGEIRTVSYTSSDRNELWFLLPLGYNADTLLKDKTSVIMIYDYKRGEWLKRVSNKITCLCVHNNQLFSAYDGLYLEYEGNEFEVDGRQIPSYYKCSTLIMDSFNTLKITKFPPRIIVDSQNTCDFWVEYIKNYDYSSPSKDKEIKGKGSGQISKYVEHVDNGEYLTDEEGNIQYYMYIDGTVSDIPIYKYYTDATNTYEYDELPYTYDSEIYLTKFDSSATVKLPSATFRSLDIKFYTKSKDEGFSFKSIEFSKIKIKQI